MPVNLEAPLSLHPVAGIRLNTVCAGIKQNQRDDLLLMELPPDGACAAVFTQNAFCAAPVLLAKQHLAQDAPRYCLVNSGNANAGTGTPGMEDALACCTAVAQSGGGLISQVLPFSTGVIGQRLPLEKIQAALPTLVQGLRADAWMEAAHAIMTTDTVAKGFSTQFELAGKTVTLTGIAKGAGMIRPDMATMLAFLATDATVPELLLKNCLEKAAAKSFNRISVDGDTSTNDACVLAATGKAGVEIQAGTAELEVFQTALESCCMHLAQAIVRDGEGATKFITVSVEEGLSEEECLNTAYTIAHSPLVKTAFFASDPNWGRILAAVGRSGIENLDLEALRIFLDDVCIVRNGGCAPEYSEAQGLEVMRGSDITVRVLLGRGEAREQVWTCDFSYDYVRINAEYRT